MKTRTILFALACLAFFASCGDEEQVYPDIVTEFVDMKADGTGVARSILLDNGTRYGITNRIGDLKPKATYRVVCGFVSCDTLATIYQLEGVHLLHDSTEVATTDPIGVLSVWHAGRFVNMHLTPKTQGGDQYWGFTVDSITEHHAHVSLHHSQLADPTSYTKDVYASLPVDSIQGYSQGDTVSLTINTFKGFQTWTMKR